MAANPLVGVVYHWLGGLASGSFYVPYKGVRRWAWETYWLAGGFFSWIIAPWILAGFLTKDLLAVLHQAPASALFWAFFFGLLWGVGGLTFGLTMRYLGLSLGMAVVLGLCAAFGTLMPPIFRGEFMTQVLGTTSGRVILFGVFVCLVGITAAGFAGIVGLALLLIQPLLIGGYLPGPSPSRARRLHPWFGGLLVAAVVLHVGALWITSITVVISV